MKARATKNEARILGKYIINEDINDTVAARYVSFIGHTDIAISTHDQRVLNAALARPWLIPYIDNALALVQPGAELRRRIYTLFTILESSPDYTESFLPIKHHPLYMLRMIPLGAYTVAQAVVGIVIVKAFLR